MPKEGGSHIYERNINIPWETTGLGDADYLHAFHHLIMPIAHEFDADLVIGISRCLHSFLWF